MSTFRSPRNYSAKKSSNAHEDYLPIFEKRQVNPSTSIDGRWSYCLKNLGTRTLRCQVFGVSWKTIKKSHFRINWREFWISRAISKILRFVYISRPVIIEVPHFASLRGKEREIVILRSDNGETWKEHTLEATEDAVQEVLQESFDQEGNLDGQFCKKKMSFSCKKVFFFLCRTKSIGGFEYQPDYKDFDYRFSPIFRYCVEDPTRSSRDWTRRWVDPERHQKS